MADPVIEVKAPAHVLDEIRELQFRVGRAARIAGTAQATAEALRDMAGHAGAPLAVSAVAAGRLRGFAERLEAAVARANQHLAPLSEVLPGDVVQVDPRGDELGFGAAFAVVEKVEGWGVFAYVRVPGPQGGDAYVRLGHGQFQKVGVAEWVHDPLATLCDGTSAEGVIARELDAVPVWKAAMDGASCAACREADGREVTAALAPPHPLCTHPDGCRCVIVGLPRG